MYSNERYYYQWGFLYSFRLWLLVLLLALSWLCCLAFINKNSCLYVYAFKIFILHFLLLLLRFWYQGFFFLYFWSCFHPLFHCYFILTEETETEFYIVLKMQDNIGFVHRKSMTLSFFLFFPLAPNILVCFYGHSWISS